MSKRSRFMLTAEFRKGLDKHFVSVVWTSYVYHMDCVGLRKAINNELKQNHPEWNFNGIVSLKKVG